MNNLNIRIKNYENCIEIDFIDLHLKDDVDFNCCLFVMQNDNVLFCFVFAYHLT